MIIRAATQADDRALAALYGHHVLHGAGTFEELAPGPEEMRSRRLAVTNRALPYLVAEDAGALLGFAYAGPFRTRAAYRYTVEDSVYVAPDAIGRGVGRALLAAVIAACEALDLRQMVAVIGGSDHAASIGLHRALGFRDAGVGRDFGFKNGVWVDVVFMQRALNPERTEPPAWPGLKLP